MRIAGQTAAAAAAAGCMLKGNKKENKGIGLKHHLWGAR